MWQKFLLKRSLAKLKYLWLSLYVRETARSICSWRSLFGAQWNMVLTSTLSLETVSRSSRRVRVFACTTHRVAYSESYGRAIGKDHKSLTNPISTELRRSKKITPPWNIIAISSKLTVSSTRSPSDAYNRIGKLIENGLFRRENVAASREAATWNNDWEKTRNVRGVEGWIENLTSASCTRRIHEGITSKNSDGSWLARNKDPTGWIRWFHIRMRRT